MIGVQERKWTGPDGRTKRPVFAESASAIYAETAEVCLDEVGTDSTHRDYWIARAQVYATLAVAARPVR